jgi:hypothetical protein
MGIDNFPDFLRENYEVHEWRHAVEILRNDFPHEWNDLVAVMTAFRLRRSDVRAPGKNKSLIAGSIDHGFADRGWEEKGFTTKLVVDGTEIDNPTHKIDMYKNRVALEVEWNNKDPFFDRDLNNFRILFELRAISVGVIVTRCDELQGIFDLLGKGKSYGNSTTHMGKLMPRVNGGGGGGCPILVFGISRRLYVED